MTNSLAAHAACASLLLSAAPLAAQAQPTTRPGAEPDSSAGPVAQADVAEEIVVTAGRPRGSIVADVQPELVLNPQDIRAYGASSVQDLLQQLSPQTSSARGRGGGAPVVLINGKRVSGFADIRNIPPEAILRVEVLPEETALSYGFRADQRVVNFVLRERFAAVSGELELGGPTAGGRTEVELDASLLKIEEDSRVLIDLSLTRRTALLESDRDVEQTVPARPYAIAGNITGLVPGAEIDPALSALAGQTVTVAGVPAAAATGPVPLAAFVPTSNQPNPAETARFRTLLPDTTELSAGASIARPIGEDIQATFSARLESNGQQSRLGLATADLLLPAANPYSPFATDSRIAAYAAAPGALVRQSDSWSGRLAAAFNGDIGDWRWSFTASHDHAENVTETDRALDLSAVQARLNGLDPAYNPFAPNAINGPLLRDRSTTNSDRSVADLVANGTLLDLPAGGLAGTVRLGLDHLDFDSFTRRGALQQTVGLERTDASVQGSLDLPIASRRRDVLAFLGDLSLNGNVEANRLSDFGTLITWGGGLTWRPVEPAQIIASYTSEEGAPTVQQLGNPLVSTPNVRVFDYATGETVEITRVDGGNPDLFADRRQVWKLGGRVNPIKDTDFSLQADWVRTRIDRPISGFPTATAEIEAAFPDRFLRGPDGRLLLIDNRPINFQRSDRSELRWGINFSERLEPTKAEREAMARRRAAFEQQRKEAEAAGRPVPPMPPWMQQRPGGGPPGGGGGGGGGGGRGGFGGGGFAEGRLQLSLFHSWRFADTILIRDGVPELDLLNGSATGNSGGTPRHLVEARAAVNKSGLGGRLAVNWQSGTEVLVDPGGAPAAEDLRFSSLTSVNLRLWADLGQRWSLLRKAPWLRGTRVSVGIDNLFDERIRVTDRSGQTPINYQPDLVDPVGRRVEVSVRKLFF